MTAIVYTPDGIFVFDKPREVWQASEIAEVRSALDRVEAAQKSGWYVVGFISYEAAPAFDPAMKVRMKNEGKIQKETEKIEADLPLAWFAAFEQSDAEISPSPRAQGGENSGQGHA